MNLAPAAAGPPSSGRGAGPDTPPSGTATVTPLPLNPALGPGAFLGKTLREALAAAWHVVKKPWVLLPMLGMSAVWLVFGLAQTRWPDSLLVRFVSFATFAGGGMRGGVAGAIGGLLGKTLVMGFVTAVLIPWLRGKPFWPPLENRANVLRAALAVRSVSAAAALALGVGLAWMAFNFMTGDNSRENCLVGATAGLACLRLLFDPGGFAKGFFLSLGHWFRGGRPLAVMTVNHLTAGLTLGFATATALALISPFEFPWIGYATGFGLALVGAVTAAVAPSAAPGAEGRP